MPAAAVDGVIEINQARALAGGVSPADTPGFPVTVGQPGSYRLTGNLTTPAASNGIMVQARDVTIDLNGFRILGPSTGIIANGVRVETGSDNFELRNGSIQSFVGPGSLVLDNVAYDNDGVGLLLNEVAWGSNILYANNGGNANSQVNANLSVQVATNQCGTGPCP